MSKSNMLSLETKRILKEYRMLESLKDFRPQTERDYTDREHFFADRILTIAISTINSKRKHQMEKRNQRFTWRDTYNPRQSTLYSVRNLIIKEIKNENTSNTST